MTVKTLPDLGWSDHFARQIEEADAHLPPARVAEIHRDRLVALTPDGMFDLHPREASGAYAVGDWILSDGVSALRRLDPVTDLTRRAAGPGVAAQRIAANIDTIAIVTSCNDDFNVARLERYLALVSSAGCLPLVVLTKSDMADTPHDYLRQAERLSPLVTALTVNAKDPEEANRLAPWCSKNQTLALIGSSGVGKTTLRNALTGENAETRDIRDDDARGRHTTTFRALRPTLAGGWLIDTPGMRELQLKDAADGIGAVFDDLEQLATQCRFNNCGHDSEPGCAITAAIKSGQVDRERIARWQKLLREDRHNSETLAQSRARGKAFAKSIKGAQAKGRHKRDIERE
ncbi:MULTISPECIES: ribosome small subunit-dependent GTPase A [Roseobacteraceae]|uniref:ribosome small subunit-dependent GTPase A n=1 Tax=Roseobacteraceae TaxID=2854170 RepID=UPI001FD2AB4A|nr:MULTISPECIES: ribosome small subunit-dependent GTPase A [Roseobacteraceae]MCJ7872470.1 ribosome small subunit-dependent GTPase A [Phaeobacter sp. J2-8]